MKRYFKDFYGSTATISKRRDGSFILRVRLFNGRSIYSKTYATERGAKVAMGKLSDGWREI